MIHAIYIYLIIGAFIAGINASMLEVEPWDIALCVLIFMFWPVWLGICLWQDRKHRNASGQ